MPKLLTAASLVRLLPLIHGSTNDRRKGTIMKTLTLSALFAVATLLATPFESAAAPSLSVPVTGGGSGLSLTGTLSITKFVRTTDGIGALGTLTGTVTDTLGVTTTVVRTITIPVIIGDTTCDILHLELGPLSLDLLGLQVDLSRIILDITAEAGAGNLLGNLLCAVAGLLDNPFGLVKLLNQILALL